MSNVCWRFIRNAARKWLEEFFSPLMSKSPKLLQSYVAAARKGGMPDGSRRVFSGSSALQ